MITHCLLFPKKFADLLHILLSESLKIIMWFKENKMTVNTVKFQIILIKKRKQYHTNEVVQIKEKRKKV